MYVPEPFPRVLKKLRLKAGMTQQILAGQAGLGCNRMSNLETGWRRPSKKDIEGLSGPLGGSLRRHLPTAPADGRADTIARFHREIPPCDLKFVEPVHNRLMGLSQKYPAFSSEAEARILALPDEARRREWLGWIPTDSCDELGPWTALLGGPSTIPRFVSLEEIDFDTFPVGDRKSARDRKAELRPCLEVPLPNDVVALLFPQVTLKPGNKTFRVDILAEAVGPRLRWTRVIEYDGDGHDPTYDQARSNSLRVPILRLFPPDLASVGGCLRKIGEFLAR